MNREIIARRPYRHFKGKLYYVQEIVTHTETREVMVCYQALYEPYDMFARPLSMFEEKIDKDREDNATGQEYRFELLK